MFSQAPATNKGTLNSSLQGNLSGSTDKQHDKHEKVNKTDGLQPSGCNGTVCDVNVFISLKSYLTRNS